MAFDKVPKGLFISMNQPSAPVPPPEPGTPSHHKGLHRHKKRRVHGNKQERFWQKYRLESGLLGVGLLSLVLLINPWHLFIPATLVDHTTTRNLAHYVAHEGGSELLGGIFLLLTFTLGLIYTRKLLLSNQRLWRRAGCPHCGRDDLRRTSRLWYDRVLNRLGLPVRRYICADCHWQGTRIDESHL